MQKSVSQVPIGDSVDPGRVRLDDITQGIDQGIVPGVAAEKDTGPVVLRTGRALRIPGLTRLVLVSRLQLGLLLISLNVVDFFITRTILARGGAEANPVMRNLMRGFAAPLGTKLAIATTAAVLLALSPATSRLADRAAASVTGVYLAIVAWNFAVLGCLIF